MALLIMVYLLTFHPKTVSQPNYTQTVKAIYSRIKVVFIIEGISMAARPHPSPPLIKGRELELQSAPLELYQFDKFLRQINHLPL
jgi:hypothetical protein